MMKMYQTEWQGIRFSEFTRLDHDRIADTDFYEKFYREFFRRFTSQEQLDAAYIKVKNAAACFLSEQFPDKDARILAIGCGLGIIEMKLLEMGYRNIFFTEVTDVPLKWITNVFVRERMFVGYFPECIPAELDFDVIYLCGVDYCFQQSEWTGFLAAAKNKLKDGGHCMVISGSYEEENIVRRSIRLVKSGVKQLLHHMKIRPLGQLWGFTRSRNEYCASLHGAGYHEIRDGFMKNGTFWIEGVKRGDS